MSGIQRTGSTPPTQKGLQQPARAKTPEPAQKTPSEPQDRVSLSAESETYHRPSARQIYHALEGLRNPQPPREPSAAEKRRTLEGLSKMITQDYLGR